ncbi:hypothetical protein [Sedimentimonas flavescens]|uniref:hypothetical protein n=1 Tax=Sedimentimonas flavescens TaxID=2851012 RepID=UPI0021A5C329|nr:hypothetical protein [Sedimentimonas flavescens]MCT2541084.1 hypothetical protein [Sedimentimonas flavescens]WBL34037.1 hypothetical protein O5O51_04870 [Sinirhodobacter sp. HNIBRBA609]
MTTKPLAHRHVFFVAVNDACLRNWPGLVQTWLPQGRRYGAEWVALNPTRADTRPGSFKISLLDGKWADFATGDRGGDPVSLYAYLNGLSQSAAARELVETWGMGA